MMHEYDGCILSYGGGVNSTALAITLANEGWRGQIVFADTGAEWPETECFMSLFETQWLAPRGLEITRLKGLPWQTKSHGDSLIDYCERAHVIPMAAVRWCTAEWKARAAQRFAPDATFLLGIDAGEAHRQPDAARPLVDAGITRRGCIKIIEAEGLPVPQKSGCWICPFQRDSQWRRLWQLHPDLFERAMRLEESAVRSHEGRFRVTLDHHGKTTLRERLARYEGQMTMGFLEDDGLLAYKPCVCGL